MAYCLYYSICKRQIMYFKNIIGQENIKNELLTQVREGRIAHTQLFCAPEGVGGFSLALAYARYLNCNNPSATDSCGTCPSCVKIDKLVHPDLHFAFPVVRNKLSDDFIEEWREFVINTPYFGLNQWLNHIEAANSQAIIYTKESDNILQKLSLKSSEGKYKITIIWLPEKMNTVCANKLLKLFEEPPAKTLFFLVSEQPNELLSTILSRTQRVDIPLLREEEINNHLISDYGISEPIAGRIAHMANGNLNKALAQIQINESQVEFLELFVQVMRVAYARRVKEIKKWSEKVAALGREKQKQLLTYWQYMVRENFIYNFNQTELNYMSQEEENFSVNFAPFINETNIFGLMEELDLAQQHIEQNVNARMVFFDFALKLIVLIKQ